MLANVPPMPGVIAHPEELRDLHARRREDLGYRVAGLPDHEPRFVPLAHRNGVDDQAAFAGWCTAVIESSRRRD